MNEGVILPQYIWARSNPIICGVELIEGVLEVGTTLKYFNGMTLGIVDIIMVDQQSVQRMNIYKKPFILLINGIYRNVDRFTW